MYLLRYRTCLKSFALLFSPSSPPQLLQELRQIREAGKRKVVIHFKYVVSKKV